MTDSDRFVLEVDELQLQRAIEDAFEQSSGWPFSEDRKIRRMLAEIATYEVAHGHQDWIEDSDGIHHECIFREDTAEFTDMLVELLGKLEAAEYSSSVTVRAFASSLDLVERLWDRMSDIWPKLERPKIPKEIIDGYNASLTRKQEDTPPPPVAPVDEEEDIVISL